MSSAVTYASTPATTPVSGGIHHGAKTDRGLFDSMNGPATRAATSCRAADARADSIVLSSP
ncbi:hypothetical protein GCM10010449_26150 [Streptomyces rectiviolaceus]|uniref:Uncharacterized protein n=1 Tax=Streptomyces rectiviolaceus TaxID=332591 RepID=A0ABP6MCV3_9ACTN